MTKATLLALLSALALLSFAGCNTMQGMGEDIEAAGQEIDEAAGGDEE